jgi:hypothetical protein
MKNLISTIAAYSTDLLIQLIVITARKIKKKLRGRKIECVEANKN